MSKEILKNERGCERSVPELSMSVEGTKMRSFEIGYLSSGYANC